MLGSTPCMQGRIGQVGYMVREEKRALLCAVRNTWCARVFNRSGATNVSRKSSSARGGDWWAGGLEVLNGTTLASSLNKGYRR